MPTDIKKVRDRLGHFLNPETAQAVGLSLQQLQQVLARRIVGRSASHSRAPNGSAIMTQPATTGTSVLRQTVEARNKRPQALSLIAREVGVGASTLENFAAGRANLDVVKLKALTVVLYPHAEFDAELALLRASTRLSR